MTQPETTTPTSTIGDDAIRAAQEGRSTPEQEQDLLDWFFERGALPGHETPFPGSVDVGAGESARQWAFSFRSLEWDEYIAHSKLAREQGNGTVDEFVLASINVAAVLKTPNLKVRVERLAEEARRNDGKVKVGNVLVDAPKGIPGLLRLLFAQEPGALLDINQLVLKTSKLTGAAPTARLADAPKG